MAYPFGICGILLSMWLVRVLFRINVDKEAKDHETTLTNGHMPIKTINIRVDNPNLNNMAIQDVPILNSANIICSRLKRDDMLMVPAPAPLFSKAICCTGGPARRFEQCPSGDWSGSGYLALNARHRYAGGTRCGNQRARPWQKYAICR